MAFFLSSSINIRLLMYIHATPANAATTGPTFLIGSVGLEIYSESALLRSLAIHPDYQGLGLGTRLVDGIIKVAREQGVNRLFLLTDTAEDYFKKRGFITVTRDQVPIDMK